MRLRGEVFRLLAIVRQVDVLVEEGHCCKEDGKGNNAGSKEKELDCLEKDGKDMYIILKTYLHDIVYTKMLTLIMYLQDI